MSDYKQTRDAAGNITSQYGQMLRNLDDDLVKQSIAELQDLVRCRCMPAYTGRGLHDPDCECDSADAVQVVSNRIEELEAKNKRLNEQMDSIEEMGTESLNALPDCLMRLAPALVENDELKAKLAKAMEFIQDLTGCEWPYSEDAKRILAELTGGKDE